VLYNATLNRPQPHGSLIVRFCCRWAPDPENPGPMPLRVRLYSSALTTFIFLWNCIGLHWSRISGDYTYTDPEYPACKDIAPDLVLIVRVYSAFNLAFTVFMYVNMVGLAHLLRGAMRLGLVHTSNAAPKGAMEKNTTVVLPDDPACAEQLSCSICFEEYADATAELRKTNICGHVFHTQCLERWLNVNRTCPLCRQDLAVNPEDATAVPPPEVATWTEAESERLRTETPTVASPEGAGDAAAVPALATLPSSADCFVGVAPAPEPSTLGAQSSNA